MTATVTSIPSVGAATARQGGFALISAIFLLVVLAALAAFIVQISTQQQIGSAADLQGVRAYQAARGGAEWGLHSLLADSGTGCAASTSFPLDGFTVTVQCQGTAVNNENGTPLKFRRIVATACNQPSGVPVSCPNLAPGANYIEREIAVVAGKI
jgi:MSHA biogenesis protein MshP